MAAQYLVRLDDACPTMQHDTWDRLEDALDSHSVKPIVGVIPENRDPALACCAPDEKFWDRVRSWQRKGWAIAMHGLHHLYHPVPRGAKPLLRSRGQSEFVGVSLEQQRAMIRRAMAVFNDQKVVPTLFMAPSHSFDRNTLEALRIETNIRVVSDGHSFRSGRRDGFIWLPQQLWRFRELPFGTWSVCLHPNVMRTGEVNEFLTAVMRYRARISDPAVVAASTRRELGIVDLTAARTYSMFLALKQPRQ